MYKCCNLKKFFYLLILDAIVISFCSMFFFVGKAFLSSAESSEDDSVKLPVIMYHSICEKTPSDYTVTPQQLENDLRWLKDHGCNSVTAEEVIAFTKNQGQLPENPVMITLDDGFYNNLSFLLPLLEKYDMTAVVSVVGSYTDNNAVHDPHNPDYSYLTWEDIQEMHESGRIEFGNHTYDMHSLNGERTGCGMNDGESEEYYRDALTADILTLQNRFRENDIPAPIVFTYPFGSVSRESIPVIRGNGFLMTLTCRELPNIITHDPDCLYGIGRFNRSGLTSTEAFMENVFSD